MSQSVERVYNDAHVEETLDNSTHIQAKRQKVLPTLKACIVEYHNDALEAIHRTIARKAVPFTNITVLHLDSHPDLCVPVDLKGDCCFKPNELYDSVDISEWMLPLVFAGHVNQILWLRPPWSDQIIDGVYEGFVGLNKDGFIRVTLTCNYFIEELLYEREDDLHDKKEFKLVVFCAQNNLGNPCETIMKHIEKDTSLLLDIDLDYFSTLNPFSKVFSEDDIKFLQKIYKFEKPYEDSYEVIKASMKAYAAKMESHFDMIKNFTIEKEEGAADIANDRDESSSETVLSFSFKRFLKNVLSKNEESDNCEQLELVHNAGKCAELPHHISSASEIKSMVITLGDILKSIPRPKFITIARSSTDDFTPNEQVDSIQDKVCTMLRIQYNELMIENKYNNSKSD